MNLMNDVLTAYLDDFVLVEEWIGFKLGREAVEGRFRVVFLANLGNMEQAVADTERERKPLADAVRDSVRPVKHVIEIHWNK